MAEDLGPFEPLSLDQTKALMSGLGAPWWIAGGWAIDLFLGRETRVHADMDVSLLRCDQPKLAALLPDWDIQVPGDGILTPWTPGDWLEGGERFQFWARPTRQDGWALEFLLEEGDAERWAYRRDPRVFLPLGAFGRVTDEGLPYVAPQVALLYKSNRLTVEKNLADFEAALPALDGAAKAWLAGALATAHPDHPWIERL